MRFSKLFYILLSVLLIPISCTTPRMFTTLDVLRPAEVSFDTNIQRIVLVDNSVAQPAEKGHYLYSTYSEHEIPYNVSLEFDSAAIFTLASLKESLESKGFFKHVEMSDESFRSQNSFGEIVLLNPDQINKILEKYQADAVVSLNHIESTDYLVFPGKNMYGLLEIEVDTRWSLHYPNNQIVDSVFFQDSFSWENNRSKNLPERYDALVDGFILAGLNTADRLIPHWEKHDRYLYVPSKPRFMSAGMEAFTEQRWADAIRIWSEAEQTKSYKTKFWAANNMAIAAEIMGDIDQALFYFNNAIDAYQNSFSLVYNEEEVHRILNYHLFLNKRKDELMKLKLQLGQ